jgi:hypothetical protein
MNKFIYYCCCVFIYLLPQYLLAQKQYSFISDRKFTNITDLIGYQFKPNEREVKDVGKDAIAAAEVAFGVTQNNLYVTGPGIKGVYSINNMIPTEYGYQLKLMNANDPTLQGHLKLFLNDSKQVDALMFKRSPREKEAIYYQAEIPLQLNENETGFFTDRNELQLLTADSIWGKIFHPFLALDRNTRIQERFQMSDNVYIAFVEKVTVIDKSKKKENATSADNEQKEEKDKKVKIIKEHFANIHIPELDEKGAIVDRTYNYLIESVTFKEDTRAGNADDHFQIILKPKGEKEIMIYLNVNKAVSFVDIEGKRYLSRGF